MNKREAQIIATYTGIVLTDFGDVHEYAEEIMGRPISTIEFANEEFVKHLKEECKKDLMKIEIDGISIEDRMNLKKKNK